MIRTQISLTPEQMAGLKRLASERKTSMAAILRDAVDHLLAAAPSYDSRIDAAAAVVGAFDSGRTDISERHDDHLADAFET